MTAGDPKKSRKVLLISGAIALVAIIAATLIILVPSKPDAKAPNALDVSTAEVTQGDLTEQIRAQGTLSFSAPRNIGTSLQGIITSMTNIGTVVTPGGELFRVDNAPVFLMQGDLPAWRSFSSGMTIGPDITQLEQNLQALGFFDDEPDELFRWSTTAAILAWQKAQGIEQTGEIELGRVVFASENLRIQAHKSAIGDAASAEVIAVTGATKEIQALIDPAQQSLAPVGTQLHVNLPSGTQTTATVTAVGSPIEKEGSSGNTLRVPLTLSPDDAEAVAALESVSVSLSLINVKREDVMLLPVSALLAQPGGGFAVDVVLAKPAKDGATKRRVAIELGTFADGYVEVTGSKLVAGDSVVIAK